MGERIPLEKSHIPGEKFNGEIFRFWVGTKGNLVAFLERFCVLFYSLVLSVVNYF